MALEMGGITQIQGQVAGLEKLASSAVGTFSLTGSVVDTLGSALGLPDSIKQIAKIAVGIATGDVAGIVSGALGLAGDVTEEMARTQYQPPADPARAGEGYAGREVGCAPSPRPPPPCGKPRVDPELLEEKRALETLTRDFGAIDNAGGFWFPDGRFSGLDVQAVARGDFPPEMKEAVRYLQRHPDKLRGMDVSDGFDGLVSRAGLQAELCRVNAEIARQEAAHPAPPPSSPVPPGSSEPPAPCGPASLEDRMLDRLGGAQREVEGLMERALANPDDKRTQLELQRAQERMRGLFEMLSGLFKMNHEMRMAAIQNAK